MCERTYRDDMSEKTSSLRTGDLVVVGHQVSVSVVALGCERVRVRRCV